MLPDELLSAAAALVQRMTAAGVKLVTAESCTGGLVAAAITDVPGSSAVLDRGFVTYSNEAKMAVLGVDPALLSAHGAVSAAVAVAMAEGALRYSLADVAVSITGIAGPGGATETKPVGLVHLAVARTGRPTVEEACRFSDLGRRGVRIAAVAKAFAMLGAALA
ncbi:MAG: damage-inducible protein CinA [Hyphomicrobium sp. 32-62-53]|nr:MAG: damage-inducible protein CinA [Hyphomicrobium sp. 12-62-95]OYX99472.1 MAG: damage-inducible protein CinA [Hyphomicrobium sp. 32-62-53]